MLQVSLDEVAIAFRRWSDGRPGLTIRERNYLEVFPYDKWSDKEIPQFQEGEMFVPTECRLDEGQTSKPTLLTEADLVSLMDEHGIGMQPTKADNNC